MKKKKELPPVEERKTEPAYEEESGNRIRFFRETKNVTQQQLANAVGVSRQEISNYETGNHEIKMDKAKLISEYLKVDLNTLFCSDEYENDNEPIYVTASLVNEYDGLNNIDGD